MSVGEWRLPDLQDQSTVENASTWKNPHEAVLHWANIGMHLWMHRKDAIKAVVQIHTTTSIYLIFQDAASDWFAFLQPFAQ